MLRVPQVSLPWTAPVTMSLGPGSRPANEMEKLEEAELKERVGVAKEVVLRELGYGE